MSSTTVTNAVKAPITDTQQAIDFSFSFTDKSVKKALDKQKRQWNQISKSIDSLDKIAINTLGAIRKYFYNRDQ